MNRQLLALGASFHFDTELAANLTPFEAFASWMIKETGAPGFVSWYLNYDNGKRSPPARPLNLPALIRRIRTGKTRVVAVQSALKADDDDRVIFCVDTFDSSRRGYRQTKARFHAYAAFGPHPLHALEPERVIDRLVAFADAIDVGTGAVYWAATARYAGLLASGGGDYQLSREQNRHSNDLHGNQHRWPDIIRGPAWGTFLSAQHVQMMGGLERITRESGAARVVALPTSGGAFVQATPVDEPLVEDHDDGAVLARLASFFAPVLAAGPA